jgi:hypothetical protein
MFVSLNKQNGQGGSLTCEGKQSATFWTVCAVSWFSVAVEIYDT